MYSKCSKYIQCQFETQFMKTLSNTEAQLKIWVAYIKKRVFK